jgi:hypothetical protein
VQWIHVYEIDFDLVGSILKALARHFPDYMIYTTQPGDIIVVAVKTGTVPPLGGSVFDSPGMREILARIGYTSLAELRLDQIASRRVIEPLVNQTRYPVNSDFFPVVDQNAARARFLKLSAHDIAEIPKSFVPFSSFMDGETRIRVEELASSRDSGSTRIREALAAAELTALFHTGKGSHPDRVPPTRRLQVAAIREGLDHCDLDPGLWLDSVEDLLRIVTPVLRGPEVDRIFSRLSASACFRRLDDADRERVALYAAFHARDAAAMVASSDRLLASGRAWPAADRTMFVLAGMSGRVVRGDVTGARRLWHDQRASIPERLARHLPFRVVLAHAQTVAPDAVGAPEPAAPEGRASMQ